MDMIGDSVDQINMDILLSGIFTDVFKNSFADFAG